MWFAVMFVFGSSEFRRNGYARWREETNHLWQKGETEILLKSEESRTRGERSSQTEIGKPDDGWMDGWMASQALTR